MGKKWSPVQNNRFVAPKSRFMSLYQPKTRFNVLKLPLIGPLLRWRWGRLIFQSVLLIVAVLLLYDGFSGPQFAPENLSTVVTWIHYRGIIVFGFLLLGNIFCMGCPFTMPRTLAKRLAISGRRWPKFLRNKWLAIGLLFFFFWAYEYFDLFASPLLTAWVILGYFIASFFLETIFSESVFCKYVCPLGTFNFVSSTISPLQITIEDRNVCNTCTGRECLNGTTAMGQPGNPITKNGAVISLDSIDVLGCGTELFAPRIKSNLDCTLCLDCVRACPHDNVILGARNPLKEVKEGTWPARWDISFLVLIFTFSALGNAFGMVGPVFQLEAWLANVLNVQDEALPLLIIFGVTNLIMPIGFGLLAAWTSRALAKREEPIRNTLARYVPAFSPLAFSIWLAHYGGFHFLGSAAAISPVFKNFLEDHNIYFLGEPNWTMAAIVPLNWLDPMEMGIILVGLLASLYVLGERAKKAKPKKDKTLAQLPWMLLLIGITVAAFWIFYLPMEMRGVSIFA
ncbi:MAG: FesM [Chloroflexota bacterium]